MHEAILKQIGLTDDEIALYETLLQTGAIKASKLAQKTPFKRVLVYKLLNDLVELGLVEKDEESATVTLFKPTHPSALKELVNKRQEQLQAVEESLHQTLPRIIADFNLVSGKPGIRFFEGVVGLSNIYDDILETLVDGENFYLVRSAYEPVYKDTAVPIINDFIKKRVKRRISVTALTPSDAAPGGRFPKREDDEKVLYNRTWIQKERYSAPVEIDIYGNKIAFLSFGKELIGVIIESAQIALALKQLFALCQAGANLPSDAAPSYNMPQFGSE